MYCVSVRHVMDFHYNPPGGVYQAIIMVGTLFDESN